MATENKLSTPALAVQPASADAAAEWLMRIMSGEMNDGDYTQWQRWRNADPDHERAWQHIESVSARLRSLHGGAAYKSLSSATAPLSSERRKLLGVLLMLGAAGGAGVGATRTQGFRQLAADYRSSVGQQRTFTLDDGTRLLLNTDSAVDVRFDASQRVVQLHAGEVMIDTGHREAHRTMRERPFIVTTAQGHVRALGTRFVVRQHEASTQVVVLEHAVEITPFDAPQHPQTVHAGDTLTFTRKAPGPVAAIDDQVAAWTRGQLIANNLRLADFLTELARYRHGVLRCDPAVADLRFYGVFPLRDPERILTMLPNSLPVRVRQHGRYWTVIEAAS